jgi:branched-subunit amino acid aminotransferase/4-amino-4-deoxychorismate lyase
MRQNVLNAAVSQGIRAYEGHYGLPELLEAELVFVTNSLMRLKEVNKIEDVLWQWPGANAPALHVLNTLRTAVEP